jgi:cysteinyl-tRNA synthetase
MIRLYNAMSRAVEDFVPENPDRVTMYVCGPTVYGPPHLGNARPAVVFDVLHRLLVHDFGTDHVAYARNLTDVDDKIIDRAAKEGVAIDVITETVTEDYRDLMRRLNVWRPTFEPTATESMPEIIKMIEKLVVEGVAYYVDDGYVFFDVSSFPNHGALSGHKLADLGGEHSRVGENSLKEDQNDFILWKPASLGNKEVGWNSPFGYGRPGWHIECSAMILKTLGKTIDIHGGGADLRFPHHDCEISQSCCANNTDHLARYWMHNAMVLNDGEKMSKSLGNVVTIRKALDQYHPQAVRLWLLSAHYRSDLDYTKNALTQASALVTQWHRALEGIAAVPEVNSYSAAILAPLRNDLNTSMAITKLVETMNDLVHDELVYQVAAGIRHAAYVLGIDLVNNDLFLRGDDWEFRRKVVEIINKRSEAKSIKDYATADFYRKQLTELNVHVEDRSVGTTWRLV